MGRVPAGDPVRPASLRHPAVVAGLDRTRAVAGSACGRSRARRRRLRGRRLRPRPHERGLRRRSGQRHVQRGSAAEHPAVVSGPRSGAARRAVAAADRGHLPRHAGQRDRGPDRQPARPRRRQLHGGRRVRVLAGRDRRGVQGTDRRHQRCRAGRWRRPAQRDQRLPDVRVRASAFPDRPVPSTCCCSRSHSLGSATLQ